MPSAFIKYIEYCIKTKCYISVQLFDTNLEMLLFLEVKKYFYFNGHIVSILSLWSLLTHAFFCLLSCCDGGVTVSQFDVCIVERMCFREEETSGQIRFLLFRGGSQSQGGSQAGLDSLRGRLQNFWTPKRKVKQVIKRDSDWMTIKQQFWSVTKYFLTLVLVTVAVKFIRLVMIKIKHRLKTQSGPRRLRIVKGKMVTSVDIMKKIKGYNHLGFSIDSVWVVVGLLWATQTHTHTHRVSYVRL